MATETVPTLADPFPSDDPLPGAYEVHLPSGGVTIWYTVTPRTLVRLPPSELEAGSPDCTQRDQFVMRKPLRKNHGLGRLAGAAAAR
jgi:hypothetical protein